MAGTDVYSLVRDWKLPMVAGDVVTYAFGDVMWDKLYGRGGQTSIGVIAPGEKLLWRDGGVQRVGLAEDPMGLRPTPLDGAGHSLQEPLERAVSRVEQADVTGSGVDEDIAERLKQIGYVD
jgi:hypothetical protein